MTAKFFALLTNQGAAKLANATALGTKLQITQMGVGDGGGTLPTPTGTQTKLVNEKRRSVLNALSVDAANSSQIIAEQIIPENEGGFWIREIGLYDIDNTLIAVANCPETYKPMLAEGSGRTQTVRMILIINSTDAVTLKIDPSVVLATRQYVDDKVIEVKAYADDLMARHVAAENPHSQYARKDSPVLTGAPVAPTAAKGTNSTQIANLAYVLAALADYAPKASPALTGKPTTPTAVKGDNSTKIASTEFVQAAIAALVDSSPASLDTLKKLAAALGGDPDFATTITNALAGKQPLDSTLSALSGKSVAAILNYLGLGTAAQRAVGTSTNQIPDMAAFNLNSTQCFRLPTGHIVQVGGGVTVNGGFTQSYQVPFPNQCLALIGTVYGLTGQRLFIATNTSDRTAANMNVVNMDGSGVNVSVGYTAIGR